MKLIEGKLVLQAAKDEILVPLNFSRVAVVGIKRSQWY